MLQDKDFISHHRGSPEACDPSKGNLLNIYLQSILCDLYQLFKVNVPVYFWLSFSSFPWIFPIMFFIYCQFLAMEKNKFLMTFWHAIHPCFQWISHSDFPGHVFWHFFMSSDLSKNLPAELQRAKNILLFPKLAPWLSHHGAAAGKKAEIKIYSNPYCERIRRGEGHTFILNQPLFISSCPPRWVSLIHLLLHPKNCQQI